MKIILEVYYMMACIYSSSDNYVWFQTKDKNFTMTLQMRKQFICRTLLLPPKSAFEQYKQLLRKANRVAKHAPTAFNGDDNKLLKLLTDTR